jgi:hypothetical protein
MNEKIVNYEIAKNHHYIHLSPLERPVKRGARKLAVERTYKIKDKKINLTVSMFKELDAADIDLLITLLAIGLKNQSETENNPLIKEMIEIKEKRIKTNTTSELIEYEKLKIKIQEIFDKIDSLITFKISGYELLQELDKTTGKANYKWLEESLKRLSHTTITIDTPLLLASTPLLYFTMLKEEKKIKITLNPINSFVILGNSQGYILINRKERLSLKKEVSKILHSVLISLINHKQTKKIEIDTLVKKVYKNEDSFDNFDYQKKKDMRKKIKEALKEIDSLLKNWKITIDRKFATISRI